MVFQTITFSRTHLPNSENDMEKLGGTGRNTSREQFSFPRKDKRLSSLHLTWLSCVNLMKLVVFCHTVKDVYRELKFMKFSHVESDVLLDPVICFLPSCFHQLLDFSISPL